MPPPPAPPPNKNSDGNLTVQQAEQLIAAVEEARKKGDAEYTVHGWVIRAKRRSNLPRCDIEVRDPGQRVTLYSIISLKRHLGLEGGGELTAKRPKRTGGAGSSSSSSRPRSAPADEDALEEDGEGGADDEDENVWVACDACGKWRQLPASGGPLPAMWFCHLHPDAMLASCAVPEESYEMDTNVAWEYEGGDNPYDDLEGLGEADGDADNAAADEDAPATTGAAAASSSATAERPAKRKKTAADEPDEWLVALQVELGIKDPMTYIAAANDLLNSPQVGFEALCGAHDITFSRGVFDSVVSIMKRIALHRPPPTALNLSHPPDAALVANLRLFLQTGTAQGGMSSRCALMPNTIAVAVEMLRDETLNVFAACLRHGFKMSDFGRSFNAHILEVRAAASRPCIPHRMCLRVLGVPRGAHTCAHVPVASPLLSVVAAATASAA